jgi:aspartate/methionine/tyrosine aminotransferase
VVPLSSFATDLQGFRITLLEKDEQEFIKIFTTISQAIDRYLAS